MPPIKIIHGNQIWAELFKEWKHLNKLLPGINRATNQPAIINTLLNLVSLHREFMDVEQANRIKNLITFENKTQNEIDEMDHAEIISACHLTLPDILEKLNKLRPLEISPNIAKSLPPLIAGMTRYAGKPDMRHRMYLDDSDTVMPHLMGIVSILTFIDDLTGMNTSNDRQFAAMACDAILHYKKLHLSVEEAVMPVEIQRAQRMQKFDAVLIRNFAEQEPRSEYLYERAFVEWSETLIRQACFYKIKYPLEDNFHGRQWVVEKIIQETIKNLHNTATSTIQRMVDLAQFILRQDIGNGVLFKLLVPVLKKVPILDKYPLEDYARDEKGRELLLVKLEEFKDSERYKSFEYGYEQYHATQIPVPEGGKKLTHKPLEPITPGEIKQRIDSLPSAILSASKEPMSSNAFYRFGNWLRGLLSMGKIRSQMIEKIKKLDPSYAITEEGFIKRRPPPAA